MLLLTVSLIDGAAQKLSRLTRLSKKTCAVGVILFIFIILCTVGALLLHKLYSECRALLLSLSESRGKLVLLANDLLCRIDELSSRIYLSDAEAFEYLSSGISSLINKGIAYLLTSAGKWAASLIGKAPTLVGASVFFVICAIWLSVDLDGIGREIGRLLPKHTGEKLLSLTVKVRRVTAEYVWAHLILFVITLAQCYIGLLLMGVPYSLALSFLIAAVDILPLLGAGTVLLPAAVITAIMGKYGLFIGIIALFIVISVTRQITEPHIVGRRLGVHPFLSFTVSFAGLALFGASGAIILPLLLSIAFSTKENEK